METPVSFTDGSSLQRVPNRDDSKPRRQSGSNPSRSSQSSRTNSANRSNRSGQPDRSGDSSSRGRGAAGSRRYSDDSRAAGSPRSGSRRRVSGDREPVEYRTEADRRRAAVRARGGGAVRNPKTAEAPARPDKPAPETWIDEGPVRKDRDLRSRAAGAVARGRGSRTPLRDGAPAPGVEITRDVAGVADPRRVDKLAAKLELARVALDRERYAEAKRIARSLLKELSRLASVHEVIGLASYRLGQWRDATAALEIARQINEKIEYLPILADCYRAQRRWSDVDAVWKDLKEQSPAPDVMAEGRIIVAGSLADRGDLNQAIELMRKSMSSPRRVREYHLRQWYVLADLYDRAGDIQRARELFVRVAAQDSDFADVRDRISSL